MTSFLDPLMAAPALLIYVVVAALVFGEAAVFVGFVLPGETACLLAGFLASTGKANIWVLVPLVVISAIVGDSVGYEVGRLFGPRLLLTRLLRKHASRLDGARRTLRERGGWAVFVGRFTAFLRAVMPGLAGMSRMPYRRFLVFNAAGGLVWGGGVTLLGFFAGASYTKLAGTLGEVSAVLTAVFVIVVVLLWLRHRRRRERARSDSLDAAPPA